MSVQVPARSSSVRTSSGVRGNVGGAGRASNTAASLAVPDSPGFGSARLPVPVTTDPVPVPASFGLTSARLPVPVAATEPVPDKDGLGSRRDPVPVTSCAPAPDSDGLSSARDPVPVAAAVPVPASDGFRSASEPVPVTGTAAGGSPPVHGAEKGVPPGIPHRERGG